MAAPNRDISSPVTQEMRRTTTDVTSPSRPDTATIDKDVDHIIGSWDMEGLTFTAAEAEALRDYAHGRISTQEYQQRTGLDRLTGG